MAYCMWQVVRDCWRHDNETWVNSAKYDASLLSSHPQGISCAGVPAQLTNALAKACDDGSWICRVGCRR